MTENQLPDAHPEVGYEASDASAGGVIGFAVSLIVATMIVLAILWWLLGFLTARPTSVPGSASLLATQERGHLPPQPRLEGLSAPVAATAPGGSDAYAWVDKSAGVVRVPIDEAIKIVAQKFSSSSDGRGKVRSPQKP